MGLKDIYYNLEEKYYNFLDWLDSKGIALYKVDDWLHNKGVAGFPVFLVFCLIILALIAVGIYALTAGFAPAQATVSLTFKDTTRNMLVSGLSVDLILADSTLTIKTDDSGKLSFVGDVGSVIPLSILDPNYNLLEDTVTIKENGQQEIIDLNYVGGLISKTVFFYDSSDATKQTFFSGQINGTATCTENGSFFANISTTDGQATVDNIATDCGNLVVILSSPDYASESFSLDDVAPYLFVSEKSEGFGKIVVTVLDIDGNPKANATVKAMDTEYDSSATSGITQASGVVELEVPANIEYYLIVTDLEGVYASENTYTPYVQENGFTTSVGIDETISATVQLSKKTVGLIKVNIKDTLGNPIEQAVIKVYKNNIEEAAGQLKSVGYYEYPVGDAAYIYRFVIDAENYMLEEMDNLIPSESAYSVTLKPIKQSPELSVMVSGTDNEPVYNASVQLFNVEKDSLLTTKTTDLAGGVSFNNLSAGKSYYVKVVKGSFSSDSQPIILSGKIENKIAVKLNIGSGDLMIKTINKDFLPVQGAEVNVYNVFTDAKENSSALYTDETGSVYYTLRADKVVYLKVTKDDSVFVSLPIQAIADSTKEVTAYIYDKATNLGLDLVAVYDSQGNSIESNPKPIVMGEEYTGYFIFRVPEGLAYDEMGVFFKADDALILEKSQMYIKSVEFFNGTSKLGTTYTPPNGTANDMQNLSANEGLWGMSSTTKVAPGNYLVKVSFGSVTAEKSLLSLNYRVWLKKGSTYLREPFDSELGTSGSADKDGLYAKTNKIPLSLGNKVCSGAICSDIVVTGDGVKQKIVDTFFAKLNGIYNIDISMLSISPKEYNNATLIIESPNKGIDFKVKNMVLGGKAISAGNTAGQVKALGINVNSAFSLTSSLEFSVMKEGLNIIKISIVGDDGTLVYERSLTVDVSESEELFADLVPGMIVPYLENDLSLKVMDLDANEAIVDALVNVYIDDKLMTSLRTDYSGFALFKVPALSLGTKVMLQVMASGYKKLEKEVIVSENILLTDVPELNFTIDRSIKDYVEGSFNVTNLTPLKLKITNIYLTEGEYKDFVKFEFKKNYVNMFLTGETSSMDLEYKVSLTEGKNLLEPKEFESKMIIELAVAGLDYKWKMELPVKVYIKLAGGLDSTDCLRLTPITETEDELWQILVSGDKEKTSMSFEIDNSCTVNGNDVYLYNPTVELVWKGTVLGDFFLDSKKLSKKSIAIYSEDGTYANSLGSGLTETSIDFISLGDLVSGKSGVTLRLKAVNPTDSGLQDIQAEAQAQVVVSILTKCLQVVSSQGSGTQVNGVPVVTLGVNQYGGMGMTGLGSGMSSVLGSGLLQNNNNSNISSSGYLNAVGSGLNNTPGAVAAQNSALLALNPNLAMQTQGTNSTLLQQQLLLAQGGQSTLGLNYNNGSLPSVAQLQIRNTCEFPAEISLQAMSQLWLDNPSFTLNAGQTQSFNITATSMVGQYAVYVSAGVNRGLMTTIAQIPVIVRDFANEISNDCFVFEGGKTIDFTGAGITSGAIKQVKMWNKCYARGLTMDKAEPVAYHNLEAVDEITGQAQGTYYATATVVESPQADTIDGVMAEQFMVLFTKNLDILKAGQEIPETPDSVSGDIDQLSALRVVAGQTQTLVKMPALLTFKYNLSYNPKSTSILVYVQDKANWLGLASKLSGRYLEGDPTCGPDKWKSYIPLSTGDNQITINVPITIKNDMFVNNVFVYPQSGEVEILTISVNCFGSLDEVRYYGNLEFEQKVDNDAVIKVKVIPGTNGQTLTITFTKPEALKKGSHPVKVEFQGEVVKKGYNKTKVYNFTINATVFGDDNVEQSSSVKTNEQIKKEGEGKGGDGTGTGAGTAGSTTECNSLYGNKGIYLDNSAYPDIKYTWETKDLVSGFCDTKEDPYNGSGYFCDQYQFTVALVRKSGGLGTLFGSQNTLSEAIKAKLENNKLTTAQVKLNENRLLEYIGYLGGYDSEISALKTAMELMKNGSYDLSKAKTALDSMNSCYFSSAEGACATGEHPDKDRFYVRLDGAANCAFATEQAATNPNMLKVGSNCYLKMTDILSTTWDSKKKELAKAIALGQTVMVFYANDPFTALEIERLIVALKAAGGSGVGDLTADMLRNAQFRANLMPGNYSAEYYGGLSSVPATYTIDSALGKIVKLKSGLSVSKAGTYYIQIEKATDGNYVFVPILIAGTEKTEKLYNFPFEYPVQKGRTINFIGTGLPTGEKMTIQALTAGTTTTNKYSVVTNDLTRLFRGTVFELTADKVYNNQGIFYLPLLTSDLSKVKGIAIQESTGNLEISWVPKGSIVTPSIMVKSGEASGEFTSVMYSSTKKSWEGISTATRNILKYKLSTGDYSGDLIKNAMPAYLDLGYVGILDAFKDTSRSVSKYCISSTDSSIKIWANDNWAMGTN